MMPICPMPFFPKSAAMHLLIDRPAGFRVELVRMRLVAMVVQKQVVCTQDRTISAIVMACLLACLSVYLDQSKACDSHEEEVVKKKSIVEPADESYRSRLT